MPLRGVSTRVTLDRSRPQEMVFTTSLELQGDLTGEQRRQLHQVAEKCKIRQALSDKISFK